jgi:hypothetical protein
VVFLKPPLSRRLTTSARQWFVVSLNLHLVEDFQLLLHHSLWSSLNQHLRALPISRRHQLQLLANLGNVLGTIEPRAGFQSLWSSLNHQIGLWSSLNHHHHLVEDINFHYPFGLWSSQNHQIQRAHSTINNCTLPYFSCPLSDIISHLGLTYTPSD